jgi:hypothetical protein
MIPQIIAILAGIALFMAVLGIRSLATGERRQVTRRLNELDGGAEPAPEPNTVHYLGTEPLSRGWRLIGFLGWVLPHVLASESLEWDLIQAGYRRPQARSLYAGCKVLGALLFGLATLVLAALVVPSTGYLLLLSATGGLLGYFVPNFWVAYARNRRCQEIRLALPDALDLMVICVEAGQGLNAALVSVGREAVLIQSDRLGTSIGKALRVHADSMRTRRRQRAEEAARKTPVKLVFPLVFFIFPELLVVILAPAVIQIVRVLGQNR